MNKSKFLKKSLAMLLALMLVLAMIPLSASAAEGEYGSDPYITVNAVRAALNGKEYTVEADVADDGTVVLGASAPAGSPEGTEVAFIGKDDEFKTGDSVNLDTQAATAEGNTYTLDVELRVPQDKDDKPAVTEYTLVITVVEKELSNNAAIKSLTNMGDNLAEYEVGADKITITSKFLKPMDYTEMNEDNFVTADPNVYDVVYNSSAKTVTVTAQDKKTVKIYEVEITMRDGLTSFEVPNQIGESDISTNPVDGKTTVKLTVPYGTDLEKLVPTFTVNEDVTAVSAWSDNNYEFVNGEDTIDASSTNPVLKLWNVELPATPKESQPNQNFGRVVVEVTVAENTAGELESIQVVDGNQKSNVTEVTGNDVTVVMPKGYDFSKGTSVTLNLVGSKEADVEVLAQGITGVFAQADGKASLANVDISSKEIVIRVSSDEDGTEYNEYTITLEAAAAAETKLENFIVKGDVDKDDVDETYEMDMETLTLELPYAAKAMDKGDLKVFVSVSTGATPYNANGTEIVNGTNSLTAFFKTDDESTLTVIASDGSKATYDIKLDYADARTARSLTSVELVGTNNIAEKTNDNTYTAVPTTAKLDTGAEVDALRVTVPYSYGKSGNDANTKTTFSTLEVSDGAVAYRVNPGVAEVSLLDPKGKGVQDDATTVMVGTDVLDADDNLIESKYLAGTTTSSVIYVVSEKIYVDKVANASDLWTALSGLADDEVSKYYIYGVNMEAQTGASLVSIESTLDENIDVTMKANNVIEITVPYSYVQNNAGKWTPFSLNFRQDSMATVEGTFDGAAEKLNSDLGSTETDGATQFGVWYNGASYDLYVLKGSDPSWDNSGTPTSKLVVSSESKNEVSGDPTNQTTYTIQVKVNEAEKGAELTSVKAAGTTATFAANKVVNVTLPYGTDKYPVKLDLEASKMATIYIGDVTSSNKYDPNKGYDLNGDVKIIVVSEDTSNRTEYTLKTTVAENFFDVAKDQWYYDEVLTAAANGWVNGQSAGIFNPNGTMTRGDFALIIARIKNYNPALYTESAFPDVESTDYYSAAIAYCKEMGYLDGDNGYFNPDEPITREQMAKIICNAAGVEQVTDPVNPYADDASISQWAKGYVYGCQAAEIMMGDESANTFDARDNATRAEAAAVLVRAFA